MKLGHENSTMRPKEEEEEPAGEDRISTLPDDLIHSILSFIDIKFSVQTSVLSSRWKLIWTTLPHLNLHSRHFPTLPKFTKFITHILSRRNPESQVSSLDLCFRGAVTQLFVKKLIDYAISHNLQSLTLFTTRPTRNRQLPLSLFNCQSLKQFKLNCCVYNQIHPLPPQITWNFPALTTLHLNQVSFCDPTTTSTKRLDLLSKCVNLVDLTLIGCSMNGLEEFIIHNPRLLNLIVEFYRGDCKFVISAPKLSSLYYMNSSLLVLTSPEGLGCLDRVTLHMHMSGMTMMSPELANESAQQLIDMFQEFRSAKYITICGSIIECLSTFPDLLERQSSPFINLKYLEILDVKRKRKSINPTMPYYVRNYFLDFSPSATVIMELPEEQPKKSRKKLKEGTDTVGFKKQLDAVCEHQMTDVKAQAERHETEMQAHIERHKAELEAFIEHCKSETDAFLEQNKAKIQNVVKEHLMSSQRISIATTIQGQLPLETNSTIAAQEMKEKVLARIDGAAFFSRLEGKLVAMYERQLAERMTQIEHQKAERMALCHHQVAELEALLAEATARANTFS